MKIAMCLVASSVLCWIGMGLIGCNGFIDWRAVCAAWCFGFSGMFAMEAWR